MSRDTTIFSVPIDLLGANSSPIGRRLTPKTPNGTENYDDGPGDHAIEDIHAAIRSQRSIRLGSTL
jgi:hypothetical protein